MRLVGDPRLTPQGTRNTRFMLLKDFIRNNTNKSAAQLEMDLVNGASLFLTRISAWLRLSYGHILYMSSLIDHCSYLLEGSNLELLLKSLTIFISASSGSRFLDEFIEVGGLVTTLEIVNLSIANDVWVVCWKRISSKLIGRQDCCTDLAHQRYLCWPHVQGDALRVQRYAIIYLIVY
jgi:hypothetical protein